MTKLILFFCLSLFLSCASNASPVPEASEPSPTAAGPATGNFHLQVTTITQQHGPFPSAYSGTNSLSNGDDTQTSLTFTIFTGFRLWKNGELYINPEFAGGGGFNTTKGIAGFPNGDIYRVDDPSPKWNLARLYYKHVFNFSGETETIKDDKNQLATAVSSHRFTVVAGKFALNDFFDNNTYSHDPRTQFLNWTLMDHGAWDYAADTKGYSWGLYLEYNRPSWALRFASVLEPMRANSMELETDYPKFRSDNLEFEYRYSVNEKKGAVRLLAFENWANMGSYRDTLNTPADNLDVTLSRNLSLKYGFAVNAEQQVSDSIGVFARASWNDGKRETWAFTEIDRALSVGVSAKGSSWGRADDTLGFALMLNALSDDHRDYLAAGGYGFMIGDGKLNDTPEKIAELYYLYQVLPALSLTGDYQYIQDPAYNADRGPVSAFALRLHYEI